MEMWISTKKYATRTTRRVKESLVTERKPVTGSVRHHLFCRLSEENSINFYNYLDWLDLAGIKDILIIPRRSHYYYTPQDIIGKRLILNTGCLNKIENLDLFFSTLFKHMSNDSYFAGCFEELIKKKYDLPPYQMFLSDKSLRSNKLAGSSNSLSRINIAISRLFNSHNTHPLTRSAIRSLLQNTGFRVLDITELNRKMYFCVQKRQDRDTLF